MEFDAGAVPHAWRGPVQLIEGAEPTLRQHEADLGERDVSQGEPRVEEPAAVDSATFAVERGRTGPSSLGIGLSLVDAFLQPLTRPFPHGK